MFYNSNRLNTSLYLLLFFFFISFSGCEKNNQSKTHAPTNFASLSGAELFRNLIFAHGDLAQAIPRLKEITDVVSKFNTDAQKLATWSNYENDLIAFIGNSYPGFFEEFKTEIVSKDLVRIDNEMAKASDIAFKGITLYGIASQVDKTKAAELVSLALKGNAAKFNSLIADLQTNKMEPAEIKERVYDIFGPIAPRLNLGKGSGHSTLTSSESACLLINIVVAVNVVVYLNGAAAVNVAVAINAAAAVNIAIAVNFYIALPSTATLAPAGARLAREQYISQIADAIQ